MAFGKRMNEGIGFGLARSSSFGKRVYLLSDVEIDSTVTTPTKKKHCSENSFMSSSVKSLLEALPQDILIRIVCAVEHDDLKALFHVSKLVQEAALIAKKLHFEYSTPRKTVGFRDKLYLEDLNEVEAPNAPKQARAPRSQLDGKKMADISVALFASSNEHQWPRRDLFMEM